MPREIPKAYEPQQIEERWSQAWVEQGLYRAEESADGPVFSIVIPPPNVTGSIHIGHMLEHTQIDILTRWHRMQGHRTLWLPGCDHAGIGTQVVVERELAKQKLTRQQLGREEFERRVWEWKALSGGNIKKQMIRLGASCDWSRERFTLDPPLYRAVLEAFLRLYREGLIYRGRYMVNWCPRCMTALSDLEIVHQERPGHLWYIRYPVIGTREHVVVATTRPETMLGDTAVAIHPDDERYQHLIGKKVLLPLMQREIPVVADAMVDREFGTGAVKVTPAHDPNDFELGKRHHLPEVDILNDDATLTAVTGVYAGMDRYAARKKVVEDLTAQGLLEKTVNHTHALGTCYRCKTVAEPRLSTQWFCQMKPLAGPAMKVVQDGLITVAPENQRKIYLDWMANIRDWCISRQLWWGHRIPIWHCAECPAMTPATDSRVEVIHGRAQAASVPQKCHACGSAKIEQDPDVLDTWFSSGLWPFSTLGWPDLTDDLRNFYPTSLLISGYDILFFWDARMIMLGLHLLRDVRPAIEERVPFRALYLHAIVRDPEGVKMSKTRGNVVDPLEIIGKNGTDALRFTLAIMAAPGTDIALSEERILSYRAFANKIWNAARFLFVNLDKVAAGGITLEKVAAPGFRAGGPHLTRGKLTLSDEHIYSRLSNVAREVSEALADFRFHEAAHAVYHFFWGDFCDWYIEELKLKLTERDLEVAIPAWRNLFCVFDAALRLLHPFMPFLTEELWHQLPQPQGARSITYEPFPERETAWENAAAEAEMRLIREVIVTARSIRADLKLDPKRLVAAEFYTPAGVISSLVKSNQQMILRLTPLSALDFVSDRLNPNGGIVRSTSQFEVRVSYDALRKHPADSLNDWRDSASVQVEIARLRKQKERLEKDVEAKRIRLADATFRSRAPEQVVKSLETTLEERLVEYQKLVERLAQLEKASGGTAAP